MKLSMMVAQSKNGVIGNGAEIPWHAEGEQLLFKAMTFNQWILVGRKTFESMGVLPHRKYAVVSRSGGVTSGENILVFPSIDDALAQLEKITDHLMVAGGGQIYQQLIDKAETLHISIVDTEAKGDIVFPEIPRTFTQVFEQCFESNINYCYQIWQRG